MNNLATDLLHNLSGIPGLSFRPLRGPADFSAITEITNASNAADGIEEVESLDATANLFEHLTGSDPQTDVIIAEANGTPIGFSRVWQRVDAEGSRLYWHAAHLLPAQRRKGIGRAMLRWNEARVLEIAANDGLTPGTPAYFQVFTQDTAVGKNALLEREGYTYAREFHFMQRKGLDDLPEAPLPPGVELRPALPKHLPLIWEAKEAAFQDHWGHTLPAESDYRRWLNDPTHDLSLWVVAWAGEQVVGISLNTIFAEDNETYGFLRGEVSSVGVLRPWRSQGLGRALIAESLRRLRQAGMTEAVLGVDADSLTGAPRLYRSLGFRTIGLDFLARKAMTLEKNG